MAHKTEFLYMSEPDTIAAGVLDARKCIDNAEEVFTLLAKGDYLMGGNNHNNHGMYIVFPKESEFPNMPVAGPDRRFVAMPAYLGGRFDICGQKWYGSNAANKKKGLPRSVLMVTLNNKDTGEPIAYMSANLLSAARTGAVPGVATRYLARKDAEVLLCIGCGAIGTSCLDNVITQMPKVKKVICNNHSLAPAEKLAAHVREAYGVEAVVEPGSRKGSSSGRRHLRRRIAHRIPEPQGRVGKARLHHPRLRPDPLRPGRGRRVREERRPGGPR